jgi:hypothetical protein
MRMPRVRFTVRRLIVAIAVIAILLGVGLQIRRTIHLSRRSAGFARRAVMYAEDESVWRKAVRDWIEHAERYRKLADQPDQRSDAPMWRKRAEYCAETVEQIKALVDFNASMKAKYNAAARRPWLDLEPDPPRPEW